MSADTTPVVYDAPDLLTAFESMFGPRDWDAAAARARREWVDVDPDGDDLDPMGDRDADRAAGYHYPTWRP